MSYKNIHKKLKDDKNLVDYNVDELDYVMKPLGSALYKKRGRPRMNDEDKALPSDKIKCPICSKLFTRSGRTGHNRTTYHRVHSDMNDKLRKLLINKI
jgi:hypothetical protein